MLKTLLAAVAILGISAIPIPNGATAASTTSAKPAEEYWELRLRLHVPRIYDNMQSLGSRKYQTQTLRGCFKVTQDGEWEPEITFCSLENKTHKIGGVPVVYDAWATKCLWHAIGSNRKNVFNTRSVAFDVVAEPSYAIGPEPTEDNSLLLTLAGRSPTNRPNRLSGYASGQIGCGCTEYGHVSPTRIWGLASVVDTASVYGTWTAKRVR